MFKHSANTVSASSPAGTVVGTCRIHPQITYDVQWPNVGPLNVDLRTGEVKVSDDTLIDTETTSYDFDVIAMVDSEEVARKAYSISNADYAAVVPVIDGLPTITGDAKVGSALTITPADATGVPTPTTTLQIQRDGVNYGASFSGASALVPMEGDIDFVFTVVQTSTNSAGTDTATSTATSAIAAADSPPVIDGVPTITGAAQEGQTLTAMAAAVTSVLTSTRTWQWYLDDVAITDETASTYLVVTGDIGGVITVVQTETNSAGSDTATSAGTVEVISDAALDAEPVITSNGGGSTAGISIAEGTTAVTTVTAAEAYPLVYSISGGADAADFAIDSITGALSFLVTPDYASPHDSDTNNTYVVDVTATAGDQSDTQTITVTITEAAGATLGPELWPIPGFTSPVGLTSSGSPTWTVTGGTATASTGNSSMSISGVCTIGRTYRHTVTISSYTSGSLRYGWTGSDITLASGVGTYSIDKVSDGTAINVGSASFVGAINAYSCKEVL